ncbi:MAG: tRNA ligase subunit PheS family protein [Minisyncoccota bacterium]
MGKTYKISLTEQEELLKKILNKTDATSVRITRFLDMPDLSRTEGSPLKEIVKRASQTKSLNGFDVIEIPEIVPTDILFDLFNMPEGHPARSPSDTYYVDDTHVLRTHDTVFWYYYLNLPEIKERIKNKETLGVICYGKVYRKDEIDRSHMNVFHQFGGLLLGPDDKANITPDDLKNALTDVATSIFGEVPHRFYDHTFPYTDPSFEMEANIGGKWIEMLGSGMARKSVLSNFGLEGYHGWAFGFGLERLAMASMSLPDIRLLWSDDERVKKQLKLGQKFKEVSKFPPVLRDVSFVVGGDFVLNDYFDRIRDIGGDQVEEVSLLDKYENAEKFGEGKTSYTFRITYRNLDKTLTNAEVNEMHAKVEEATKKEFDGTIRLS